MQQGGGCLERESTSRGKLYEDMEVPVFYNPTNPEENVSLCAASCDLRMN